MTETLPLNAPLTDRSSNGVALAIGRLISTGELQAGDKLPTVRAVAKQLQVSPTTISDAWRILQSHGAIATDGRRGTFVRGPRQGAAPGRYWQVPVDPGTFATDLSTGTPDPQLLPPLGPLLRKLTLDLPVTSYLDAPVLPELETVLRSDWPFPAEMMTLVDGAQDGLDRLVQALVNVGDVVLVNDPAFPPLLDMLDQAGARTVGVPLDGEGLLVDELAAALGLEPVALFVQPRAHNPTGVTLSARRSQALAGLLADRNVVIVEDDHSGEVSGAPLASIGVHLPGKVVQVRSFSKSHGPDLRLAAVGGAAVPVDAVVRRRRLGPSWSSRLLQQLLLAMLTDDDTVGLVECASGSYMRRRALFVDALAEHDVTVGGDSGLNLWVPVADEQLALVALAANGIGAAPGAPFAVDAASAQPRIRISIGTVADNPNDIRALAAEIATAASIGQPRTP